MLGAVVLAPLSVLLMQEAPGLRLRAVPWGSSTVDDLERGGTDLALYADGDLPGDYLCRELFEEHYVAAVREDHPLVSADHFENEICN